MNKNNKSAMTWSNLLSIKRIHIGKTDLDKETRSPYERDYLRILYSDQFRRLSDKTQVFTAPHNAVIHNRLTHTLEVSTIGRSLARIVANDLFVTEKISENDALLPEPLIKWYKETYQAFCPQENNTSDLDSVSKKILFMNSLIDVVATACLAHDLGNTPFGHAGEAAIQDIIKKFETPIKKVGKDLYHDLFSFDGNNFGLRMLLTKATFDITGASLGAFVKYPITYSAKQKLKSKIDIYKKVGIFSEDKDKLNQIFKELTIPQQDSRWARHPLAFLMEAADDIGYIIMDFEDAVKSNIINVSDPIEFKDDEAPTPIMDVLFNCLTDEQKNKIKKVDPNITNIQENKWISFGKCPKKQNIMAVMRAYFITNMIFFAKDEFIRDYANIMEGTREDSLLSPNAIIQSDEFYNSLWKNFKILKDFSKKNIYQHRNVRLLEGSGYAIISNLLENFLGAELQEESSRSNNQKHSLNILQESTTYTSAENRKDKIIAIVGFVAGMTDKYAIELYQRINGHIFHGVE